MPKRPYRGRFAPSPSGPLHFGSLFCALASYLDAKANKGQWLVRIEDIDPPREQPGASASILKTLLEHGLRWDEDVLYQSTRSEIYRQKLDELLEQKLAYRCNCTRKRLSELDGPYDGNCLKTPPPEQQAAAIRLNLEACLQLTPAESGYQDLALGDQISNLEQTGDFIIHRKDGLFAYQLAVVVDDIAQEITHIVRGADLLDTTTQQRYLYQVFGKEKPLFVHAPVLVDSKGNKLSKQNHAKPVDNNCAAINLKQAFSLLGMRVPNELSDKVDNMLRWGIQNWNLENFAQRSSILAPSHTM